MNGRVEDPGISEERPFIARHMGDPDFFGDPDGARADLDDYIDLGTLHRSMRRRERTRVVIGRKGSGKTLYLRKFRDELTKSQSVLLFGSATTQLPTTEDIVRVAHWFPERLLTEVWQLAWSRAILASLASYVIHDGRLKAHLPDDESARMEKDFRPILGSSRSGRSPLTTLRMIVNGRSTGDSLFRYLNDILWDDLESRLGSLLPDLPPIYFILDAIDEEFAKAPAYWMRCQKGLFYETMRMLRNPELGGRLHVVISIRDIVFHSVFQSEHASRYVADPHITTLDWSYESACAFLDAKIERLGQGQWLGATQPHSLQSWVGITHVTNSRGDREDVYSFLFRHTQCLPRDVVVFGNIFGALCQKKPETKSDVREAVFKEAVADVARLSGLTQLAVVANQVIADEIPLEASRFDFMASYLSVDEYRYSRLDELSRIIGRAKYLRVGREEITALQESGMASFGAPDLASVLWQSGLLGVEEEKEAQPRFFSMDRLGRMRLPSEAHSFVFHPSMREVAGLKARGPAIYWLS